MQVAERGKRRPLAVVGWIGFLLIAAAGWWLSSWMWQSTPIAGLIGYLVFGLLFVVGCIKLYGAFTGVKRFGKPKP